jgi:hypothetical protein
MTGGRDRHRYHFRSPMLPLFFWFPSTLSDTLLQNLPSHREQQSQQEKIKVQGHVMFSMAIIVCGILSDPGLPLSPTPLSTMVMTSFLEVLDMVRLETLLRLQLVKWACFAFLVADRAMRGLMDKGDVRSEAVRAALLGTITPLVVAAVAEAVQRDAFLRDCKRPRAALGSFWLFVMSLIPGRPAMQNSAAEPVEAGHPHDD